ncbi:MAG: CBS domain-containing protein, partial [Marinobacter sp.]
MGQQFPISRIMHSGMLLQCSPDTTIALAATRMADQSVSSILITEGGQVAGIWTEHDALAVDFSDADVLQQPIASVMSAPVATL